MADISADPYGWSTTEGSNSPAGSVNVGPGLDDNLRAIQAGVKTLRTRLSSVSGTNTITASIANVAAYAAGQQFSFTPASDNSGATTININSLGAKNIFANGVALAGGELRSGIPVVVEYDGTQFNILGLSPAVPLYGGIGKNAIIGGDFSTNPWQRGTSFSSVAANAYTADRWIYGKTGAMVHDISKAADAPTVAQAGRLTNHCLLVDCTTVDSSIAAGDFCYVGQFIEGYNFLPLAQRTMTLSFWHKHTKTGTYCVAVKNSGTDRTYVAEYTQDTTDTWERATVTITASPSAGTWDYTTGIGLYVLFPLVCGVTFQTTASAWQTGNFIGTANQVNACDSTSNNFKLALVQLEAGSVATEFEARQVQVERMLCERYLPAFQSQSGSAIIAAGGGGLCFSTTEAVIQVPLRVSPRIPPTGVTVSNATHFGVYSSALAAVALSALTFGSASDRMVNLAATVAAGLTAGDSTALLSSSTSAQLLFTGCEL
jgi:hypothetical protein